MGPSSVEFPARMDAFPRVADFLEDVGRAAGFGRPDTLRLRLVVEELFTNTVSHGHGRDSEAPVRLTASVRPGRVELVYEDTGPPYDPLVGATPPPGTASVEERPVGGLGVVLVASLAEEVHYAYRDGRNRVSLAMSRTC